MELHFRHSKLLANPVHLRAIHIDGQYGRFGRMYTVDTYFCTDSVCKRYKCIWRGRLSASAVGQAICAWWFRIAGIGATSIPTKPDAASLKPEGLLASPPRI